MYRQTGPSTGNRRPTVAVPGSKGSTRPAPQKGGGGNKAAGSVEPTAANTPTVSVSPTGEVTTQNFGPSAGEQRQAARAKRQAVESRRRVQKVRTYVRQRDKELTPKREVHVSKGFLERQQSEKPVTVKAHERPHPSEPKKTIPVAEHQRALPTKQEKQQVRQKVHQARQEVQAASPHISGLRNKAQEEFAAQLSKKTGIPPKLAGEWVLQESGASSAGAGGEAGEQNQLGVGYPAHPTSFSESPYFNNTTPRKAANATAKWMEGKIGQEFGYQAAPSIQNIPKLAKSGASEQQVREYIEGPSRWGTGTIAQSGVTATPGKPNPKAQANLKAALKEAKEIGLPVKNGHLTPGRPSKQTVTKYKAARSAMSELDKLNNEGKLPYVWGGHHGNENSFDCSGAVSYVLEKLKVLPKGGALVSGDMGSVLEPGPGALTVFYNGEHTFIYDAVKKEFWGTSNSNVGGGAGYFPKEVGQSEVQEGNSAGAYQVGHIPGLGKKQALQMGGALGGLTAGTSSQPIPGMELSEGGTTATIVEGQGVKVEGKPGFSKKPIELTQLQKYRRNVRKLRNLGVEVSGPFSEPKEEQTPSSPLHKQLAALEKKYSIGAV